MFPDEIFRGITMYDILFSLGILTALILFRVLSDKREIETKLFNFALFTGVAAIAGGAFSSVLFQALYNYGKTGVFVINKGTGMTFYGGLAGGATTFLIIYFIVGHFVFRDGLHLKRLELIADMAACSVSAAHATGRLGCFSAGCCYGIHAEPPLGVYMKYPDDTVLPVQLYESIFLFALSGVLVYRCLKKKKYDMAIYLIAYGIFRFFAEFLRGDDRGSTFIPFLSPSQLTALILVPVGIVVYICEKRRTKAE